MGIEILVGGAFDVWSAPVGEAFPDINDAPTGNWAKIGQNGSRNYDEEGIALIFNQEIEKVSGLGGTEILKVMRVLEEFMLNFTLFDLTAAELTKAINFATVQDTAAGVGTGGHLAFSLSRGLEVATRAILLRGENKSTELVTENIQVEVPEMAQIASPEITLVKGEPAKAKFELQAIANYTYDPPGSFAAGSAPYGLWMAGDEVAS